MFHFLDRAPFGSSRGSYEILDLNFQQLFLMKEWTYELCQLFCIDYDFTHFSYNYSSHMKKFEKPLLLLQVYNKSLKMLNSNVLKVSMDSMIFQSCTLNVRASRLFQ